MHSTVRAMSDMDAFAKLGLGLRRGVVVLATLPVVAARYRPTLTIVDPADGAISCEPPSAAWRPPTAGSTRAGRQHDIGTNDQDRPQRRKHARSPKAPATHHRPVAKASCCGSSQPVPRHLPARGCRPAISSIDGPGHVHRANCGQLRSSGLSTPCPPRLSTWVYICVVATSL